MTLWYPTAKQHVFASKVSIASLEVCYVHLKEVLFQIYVCVCVCKGILKYSEIRSLDGKRNGFLLLRQSGEIKTETLSKSSCRMVKLGS